MGALVYGGKFEQHINHLYSPENIHETAKKFKEHVKKHGNYTFGDTFTKDLVPDQKDWADGKGSTKGHGDWEKHSGAIPEAIRRKITEVISTFAEVDIDPLRVHRCPLLSDLRPGVLSHLLVCPARHGAGRAMDSPGGSNWPWLLSASR